MFEKAVRQKIRFNSPKGLLTVEDLWDLPLTSTRNAPNLNDIAKEINRELKAAGEENFVNPTPSIANTRLQLMLDIVKHIIEVRLAENAALKSAAEKKERKEKLLGILADKEEEHLKKMSPEEIRTMIASL